MEPEVEFILSSIDNNGYMSKQTLENGKTVKVSLMGKYLKSRMCREKDFCRDEIYDLYLSLGDKHAYKKADDIFFRANTEQDSTISEEEFAKIIRMEYEKVQRINFKQVERTAQLTRRIKQSRCQLISKIFTLCRSQKRVKIAKNQTKEDTNYHSSSAISINQEVNNYTDKIATKDR